MITLFNQLTSKELVDYTLFSRIIDSHYEKFKYLYYIIKNIDLDDIESITCTDDENNLLVTIIPNDINRINDIIYTINARQKSYKKSNYFDIDVECDNASIHIDISMSGDEKESEIYANRLI